MEVKKVKISKSYIKYPIIAIIFGVLLAFVLNIRGIYAYLTDNGDITNKIAVGENSIEIEEIFNRPPLETGTNKIVKDVKIKNNGNIPCFIRVIMEFSDNDVRNESTMSSDGVNFYPEEQFRENLPSGWVYVNSDESISPGYYYYTLPVGVGDSTSSLLKFINTTFSSEDKVEPFDVLVYAESIQTLDKDGNEFTGDSAWRNAWAEYINE